MNDIQTTLLSLLPSKRKNTPSGWISFNSVCCHHRGESADRRQRGGLLINSNGGFQYHCFNCNFKAGWNVGTLLTQNTKQLFIWLGMNDADLAQLNLFVLKNKQDLPLQEKIRNFTLIEKTLPNFSKNITEYKNNKEVEPILKYLEHRGMNLNWYPWHWSSYNGFKDRLLIPFYHEEKIVGWTARKITDGNPKYLTESQSSYVFNLDKQTYDRKYTILVEGPLDAIAIDGIAVLHNQPNETQCSRINALNKEIIVVPDRDKAGAKMLNSALEYDWSVSIPPWESDIKDVADAVKRYGRLYTLFTIIHYKELNKLKIQLMKKKLETV